MGETENSIRNVGGAAEEAGRELASVFAEYLVPIFGIVVGFSLGTKVGGVHLLSSFINDIANPSNNPSQYGWEVMVGGLIIAGIYALAGAALWSISRSKGGERASAGTLLRMVIARGGGGMFFGLALSAIVQGATTNPSEGWIESAGLKAATAAGGNTSGVA